jgi:hypothetical protein
MTQGFDSPEKANNRARAGDMTLKKCEFSMDGGRISTTGKIFARGEKVLSAFPFSNFDDKS